MLIFQWILATLVAVLGATVYFFGCLPLAMLLTKRGYEGIGLFVYAVLPLPVIGLIVFGAYMLPAGLWAASAWARTRID